MMRSGPPAIFFHPDAIEGDGKDLVGRRAAGQSFLRGFLAHMPGDTVRAVTEKPEDAGSFDKVARGLGETRPIAVRSLRGGQDFTEFGTVFFPAPGYLQAAWRREAFGARRCSLVGVTHTVSTRRVIENLHYLMLEPVAPWDAIICTSRAVQSVVQRQFELEAEYIRVRFGARQVPQPRLPVIPLGVHTDDFVQTNDDRARMRARFGAPNEAVVILTVGRHTSVEKANPAPLLIVLERIAQSLDRPLHLWMAGWANRDDETRLHEAAAARLAPSVRVQLIDGREAETRRHIWAGADIFTLPVDNIQETFGLVPVEAMAAGLPVVMPDWNGFRDTILHGETGFLIPTRMPGPGHEAGLRLARRFADGTDDYLRHLSLIQQQTQIDLPAYEKALRALIEDPDLRQRMGQAGRRHAGETFDWRAIIPRYSALADELAEQRAAAADPALLRSPIEVDPFDLYRHYPSQIADGDLIVEMAQTVSEADLDALDAVNGRALYRRRVLPNARMAQIAARLEALGPVTIATLAHDVNLPIDVTLAAVLFLAKYDMVILTQKRTN